MNMSEEDPRRMDELRKYAAIYGRFDAKRKPEKPLTMHEVCCFIFILFIQLNFNSFFMKLKRFM